MYWEVRDEGHASHCSPRREHLQSMRENDMTVDQEGVAIIQKGWRDRKLDRNWSKLHVREFVCMPYIVLTDTIVTNVKHHSLHQTTELHITSPQFLTCFKNIFCSNRLITKTMFPAFAFVLEALNKTSLGTIVSL